MAFELTDLRVLLAVVDHGSFSRAATTLVMTQPSVSERMAGLERAVGVTLFERSARGAIPTAPGRQFASYARRCVALADEAVEQALAEAQVPWLRVALHTTFAHRAVPLVLDAIASIDCRLVVHDAHSDEVLQRVIDGTADVGFVIAGPLPRGLAEVALPRDPVVCVARPDHALAGANTLRVADLTGYRIALNAWGDGAGSFVRALRDARSPAPWLREISDARTAALLALDHDHLAVLTRSSVASETARGDLVELPVRDLGRWSVQLAAIYRNARAREPVVGAVIDAVRSAGARRAPRA